MTEILNKPIRVGSRKSELALIQTKHVISQLQKLYQEKCFEIHTMSTIGDRVLNVSLPKIGEKSLFTRDLEDALKNGRVDFVVHSLKDLPTALPTGMVIGAVLEREDSRDALVLNEKYKGKTIDTLPAGCVIGTSSLRRTAQLRRLYPSLEICDIRGNLNTRLAKLDAPNSKFAGIILAQAGLVRMGWMNRISQILEPDHMLYAVGQGALAVECRSNDYEILEMLQNLMCLTTTCRILAERSFLKTLGGGCSAPVAVSTQINDGSLENNNGISVDNNDNVHLNITGSVWSLDGKIEIKDDLNCCLGLQKKRKNEDKSDVIDDDESTRKKIKIENENENSSEGKQSSPKIVNDDKFTEDLVVANSKNSSGGGDGDVGIDLQYLINIHGELFKKCPFYAQHQQDRENGNTSTKIEECPLNIPIGQDFMGKCPYVDTTQKVELSEKHEGACPITGKKMTSKNDNNNQEIPKTKQKCPFTLPSTSNVQNFSKKINNEKELGHKDCPFIQKNIIKMIDCDEEKLKDSETSSTVELIPLSPPPTLIDDSNQLFCGLYRHKCYKLELFSKCEELGKQLADNLIKKGALDVMKCAQQEIREKS